MSSNIRHISQEILPSFLRVCAHLTASAVPLLIFLRIYAHLTASIVPLLILRATIMTITVMESVLVAFGVTEWMCIAIAMHITRFRLNKEVSLRRYVSVIRQI